jgi:hypothetical protein
LIMALVVPSTFISICFLLVSNIVLMFNALKHVRMNYRVVRSMKNDRCC